VPLRSSDTFVAGKIHKFNDLHAAKGATLIDLPRAICYYTTSLFPEEEVDDLHYC
jgi:hypothetical protein